MVGCSWGRRSTSCTLALEAWDEDVGSSNDLIGVGTVDLSSFMCEDRASTQLTVPLKVAVGSTKVRVSHVHAFAQLGAGRQGLSAGAFAAPWSPFSPARALRP